MSSELMALDLDQDNRLLQLAREIAMDILDLGTILKLHNIKPKDFEEINNSSRFQDYLRHAIVEWNSALNTQERIAVKSAASVELALPNFHRSMLDEKTPLIQRVEALKVMSRLGRVIETGSAAVQGGSGFSVSITIGDKQIKFDTKPDAPTIEGEAA